MIILLVFSMWVTLWIYSLERSRIKYPTPEDKIVNTTFELFTSLVGIFLGFYSIWVILTVTIWTIFAIIDYLLLKELEKETGLDAKVVFINWLKNKFGKGKKNSKGLEKKKTGGLGAG